jgi:hypothetical protein
MWNPYVWKSSAIDEGEVKRLADLVGVCIDNAGALGSEIRSKWFGVGFNNTLVEKCISAMTKWKKDTHRGLNVKYRGTEDDLASAPLYDKHKQLLGEGKIGDSSVSINLGKNWLCKGAATGCKLISLLHEMTHGVICTLDVADNTALAGYPQNVKNQIPTNFLTAGKVYYGMKNVFALRDASSRAAVLNAENWAYFLAEGRGKTANLRFLTSTSEAKRTKAGWNNYDVSSGFMIINGELF